MKFCKNLQRVVDISDPEWAPYWTNYKMLKKLIKELPSLVPVDEGHKTVEKKPKASSKAQQDRDSLPLTSSASHNIAGVQQQRGDETTESKTSASIGNAVTCESLPPRQNVDTIEKSPGEVAFFKLLHSELKKATHFFEKAQQEFLIREERVREGMEIMKQPNSIMVNEKWSFLAKSIYRLYKDLLLLETFAIMTYCSFSKILKKHDKVTRFNTRNAFMANVVNKANFTNYPVVLEMINRCERLYEEVSERLQQEGKHGLYEDERLFINMIHRLNDQVLGTAQVEGVPEREGRRQVARASPPSVDNESHATSTLRSLVEENDAKISAAQVSEGHAGDDTDDGSRCNDVETVLKRAAERVSSREEQPDKRLKTSCDKPTSNRLKMAV